MSRDLCAEAIRELDKARLKASLHRKLSKTGLSKGEIVPLSFILYKFSSSTTTFRSSLLACNSKRGTERQPRSSRSSPAVPGQDLHVQDHQFVKRSRNGSLQYMRVINWAIMTLQRASLKLVLCRRLPVSLLHLRACSWKVAFLHHIWSNSKRASVSTNGMVQLNILNMVVKALDLPQLKPTIQSLKLT